MFERLLRGFIRLVLHARPSNFPLWDLDLLSFSFILISISYALQTIHGEVLLDIVPALFSGHGCPSSVYLTREICSSFSVIGNTTVSETITITLLSGSVLFLSDCKSLTGEGNLRLCFALLLRSPSRKVVIAIARKPVLASCTNNLYFYHRSAADTCKMR
ncbi:hypothetical protein CPB84DRAFT_193722 [Gymnopilus junonius]|uniref:Uncharacterized protein n=1 Tax=Gymnopilus junonius TaxID=109634 RepID=A0A9P5NEK3_GYMJU|nr:hypothetical protein CPB84DRAFT_193722 [Gymnopilus junonius]